MNQLVATSRQIDGSSMVGRVITFAAMHDDSLFLGFDVGLKVEIFDNGQCCCERRHMSTDDDLSLIVGSRLIHVAAKDGGKTFDDDYHETMFIEIQTDRGLVTIVNHNEHNGYYGGFEMTIRQIERFPDIDPPRIAA